MKPIDLNIEDYHEVVEAIHQESDRAAAVLGGSFIENYLAKYLQSFMIDDPDVAELFDNFGPFADYMQRYETAYAFGFISSQQRNDLKYIGKIRNHFAHHPLDAGFDKQPVSDWCSRLSTYAIYPLEGQQQNLTQDNRSRFMVGISLCVGNWHNSMLKRANKASRA